jgi:hypothetical protein
MEPLLPLDKMNKKYWNWNHGDKRNATEKPIKINKSKTYEERDLHKLWVVT